jgi:hypothetical protein
VKQSTLKSGLWTHAGKKKRRRNCSGTLRTSSLSFFLQGPVSCSGQIR